MPEHVQQVQTSPLTVSDLIGMLDKYPKDMLVYLEDPDTSWLIAVLNVKTVQLETHSVIMLKNNGYHQGYIER